MTVFLLTRAQAIFYDHNDEASNITHAAISDGELIIRDPDKQTINELSHDTENAHSKLKPIFNKEDEQTRLNIVTSLKELGEQVKELERTIKTNYQRTISTSIRPYGSCRPW